MRSFPVGRIEKAGKNHLGIVINNTMLKVLRPFLEKWQANYRHWWENESNPNLPPFKRQAQFPKIKEFLDDWCKVRTYMKSLEKELVKTYKLVNTTNKDK